MANRSVKRDWRLRWDMMMSFCGWVDGLRQPENAGCGGLHVLLVLQPAHLVFGGDFAGEPCAVFFGCPEVVE